MDVNVQENKEYAVEVKNISKIYKLKKRVDKRNQVINVSMR